jgi:hypothetical protein
VQSGAVPPAPGEPASGHRLTGAWSYLPLHAPGGAIAKKSSDDVNDPSYLSMNGLIDFFAVFRVIIAEEDYLTLGGFIQKGLLLLSR